VGASFPQEVFYMLKNFLDLLAALFGTRRLPPPPPVPADDPGYLFSLRPQKVLLIVFDPKMPDGQPLSRSRGWNAVSDLVRSVSGSIAGSELRAGAL
jgi:hypothetical protein